MNKYILVGGGNVGRGNTLYETEIIDKEAVKLTGKDNPNLLFIGLASSFSDSYYDTIKKSVSRKCKYLHFSFEITDYTFEAEAAEYDSRYKAGSPVTLKVNTQCDHLDEVTYEWYDNDNELIDGETGDSISLSLSKPGDYEYSCIVNYPKISMCPTAIRLR